MKGTRKFTRKPIKYNKGKGGKGGKTGGETLTVEFNAEARHEFVTGFHKRKVEAHKLKVANAKQRDKNVKIESQREKRARLSLLTPLIQEIEAVGGGGASSSKIPTNLAVSHQLTTKTIVTVTPFDFEKDAFSDEDE